jgi:hypothetical protein
MSFKTIVKFKGDNLMQYENCRNPEQKFRAFLLNEEHTQGLRWDSLVDSLKPGILGKLMARINIETDQYLNTVEEYNPILLGSKASEYGNPTYEQAMSGQNR